ncbi:MAG: AAA family ATPase [Trueperaceae bacterium]|nr:AAA family ATPase [Trueperaceae bacterium]
MKINSLALTNFRGFAERSFEFSDEFNIFIGDNATGKTAILDALSIAVGSYLMGIDTASSRHIREDEIRIVSRVVGESITLEKQFPVVVACEGSVPDNQNVMKQRLDHRNGQTVLFEDRAVEFSIKREIGAEGGRTTYKDATRLIRIAEILQERVRNDNSEHVSLPLISYHGTGRLWLRKRDRHIETKGPTSRMSGYEGCIDAASNEKELLRWFKKMEYSALQRKTEGAGVLRALKHAIKTCLDGCKDVRFEVELDELVFLFENPSERAGAIKIQDDYYLPFRMLSDGQREIVGLVADVGAPRSRCSMRPVLRRTSSTRESEGHGFLIDGAQTFTFTQSGREKSLLICDARFQKYSSSPPHTLRSSCSLFFPEDRLIRP